LLPLSYDIRNQPPPRFEVAEAANLVSSGIASKLPSPPYPVISKFHAVIGTFPLWPALQAGAFSYDPSKSQFFLYVTSFTSRLFFFCPPDGFRSPRILCPFNGNLCSWLEALLFPASFDTSGCIHRRMSFPHYLNPLRLVFDSPHPSLRQVPSPHVVLLLIDPCVCPL